MKDNKVIFWSVIKGLEEVIPPQPAKKYIPNWYKDLPPFVSKIEGEKVKPEEKKYQSTIKVCPVVHDWFLQGYVLPMWCDLYIEINEDNSWSCNSSFPNMSPEATQHSAYITWLPEQYKKNAVAMFRIKSPWRMKTPAGYSSYQFPMYYHFNPDFEVPPGPVWSDEYHLIDPQIIIKHYGVNKINCGTPLCVYVPYKREPDDTFQYEIKRRDEECEILEQKTDLMAYTKFEGGYKEMQKEKSRCPMHKEHE